MGRRDRERRRASALPRPRRAHRPAVAGEAAAAPHHLFGVADGRDAWSVGRWSRAAAAALAEIAARGRPAIVVGGTGLYFAALTRGLSKAPAGVRRPPSGGTRALRGRGRGGVSRPPGRGGSGRRGPDRSGRSPAPHQGLGSLARRRACPERSSRHHISGPGAGKMAWPRRLAAALARSTPEATPVSPP